MNSTVPPALFRALAWAGSAAFLTVAVIEGRLGSLYHTVLALGLAGLTFFTARVLHRQGPAAYLGCRAAAGRHAGLRHLPGTYWLRAAEGRMKRTRRELGFIFLGLAVGFMLGEVKQVFQPNQAVAWVLGLLTLACLLAGFYLTRSDGPK